MKLAQEDYLVEDTNTQSSMINGASPTVLGDNLDHRLMRMRMRRPLWSTNNHLRTP